MMANNTAPVQLRSHLFIFFFLVLASATYAQKNAVRFDHVEPAFWWTGMKNNTVQILFHNKSADLTSYQVSINHKGVVLKDLKKVENPHYLFITLELSPDVAAGNVPITFTAGRRSFVHNYELKTKSAEKNRIQGFNSSDVLYLIMPDRFANGDVTNDSIPGMLEGANRAKDGARHGGDLKGITDHLDYIKELGVTATWLNPVLENNQKRSSYHGYAITDLYNVDRRFGGNAAYLAFITKSHELGLKVIQDMVMNHIGDDHWLMHDPPEKDWIHQFPEFTRSNYQGNVVSDPYQSQYDAIKMNDGWFDNTMPDVNQKNPLFATYLIQNTLWWIEYAGIDGIRMDTHPYPDKDFMSQWAKAVLTEYPGFNVVGEVWLDNSIPATAYWQKGMVNKDGYESNLPTVTDFPFCFAVAQALNEPGGWNTGMRRLYVLLSQDFIYPDANNNLTFLDNHDMTRIFRSLGRDKQKLKMALTFLLTTRGIPQLYYGTELLMDGDGGHHPNIRKDFPGGWPGDPVNAFRREGRNADQNEIFDFMKGMLSWRKGKSVIHSGKLTHYIPEDNIYVYFRHNDQERVMVVMNANEDQRSFSTARFAEDMKGHRGGREITTGASLDDLSTLNIPGRTAFVIELQ